MLRDAERICRFDVEFTGFDFGAGETLAKGN